MRYCESLYNVYFLRKLKKSTKNGGRKLRGLKQIYHVSTIDICLTFFVNFDIQFHLVPHLLRLMIWVQILAKIVSDCTLKCLINIHGRPLGIIFKFDFFLVLVLTKSKCFYLMDGYLTLDFNQALQGNQFHLNCISRSYKL